MYRLLSRFVFHPSFSSSALFLFFLFLQDNNSLQVEKEAMTEREREKRERESVFPPKPFWLKSLYGGLRCDFRLNQLLSLLGRNADLSLPPTWALSLLPFER